MNKLPIAKRVQIINLLVEGSSLRAASRIADVSINTVTKLAANRIIQSGGKETIKRITKKEVEMT